MRTRHPANTGAALGMPLTAWPAADRAAWEKAFRPVSGFRFGGGGGAKLREPSIVSLIGGYARWLAWLRDHEPDTLADLAENRATEARVTAFLEGISEEIAYRTLFNYGCRLKQALTLICPGSDWRWFDPLLRDLKRMASATPSPRRGFVPSHQLFDHGLELMQEAEGRPEMTEPVRAAELFRDGLMFAFLALRPLRLKNMTQLELGTELVASPAGYDITILPDKTKTKNTLEFPLPAALVPAMRRYLQHYRPALAAAPMHSIIKGGDPARPVWLARSGAQFPEHTFADMITSRTLARFAVRLSPHEFRHCAATSIAEFNPKDFHIIRMILGHTGSAMAEQYYIRAKGLEAVRTYQKVVTRKRKELSRHPAVTPERAPVRDPGRSWT
jgi:integrase